MKRSVITFEARRAAADSDHLLWQDYVATLRNAVEGICYPLIEEVKEHGENLGERPR